MPSMFARWLHRAHGDDAPIWPTYRRRQLRTDTGADMTRTLGRLSLTLAAVVAATTVWAAPAQAATYSAPLRTAVASLTVATEVRTGYNRDLFPHWIDADGDGCNTRY